MYVMSPAVEGVPYSSNNRIRSPNWPCRSPKIFTGAFSFSTLGSRMKMRSAWSHSWAICGQGRAMEGWVGGAAVCQ